MVLPEDPEEVYYGTSECGTCHAKLDNGKHLCMVDFVCPEHVMMNVYRDGRIIEEIELTSGDVIEYESISNDGEI